MLEKKFFDGKDKGEIVKFLATKFPNFLDKVNFKSSYL